VDQASILGELPGGVGLTTIYTGTPVVTAGTASWSRGTASTRWQELFTSTGSGR